MFDLYYNDTDHRLLTRTNDRVEQWAVEAGPDKENIKMEDVLAWIADAEYWEFVVTRTGRPDQVLLSGHAHFSMQDYVDEQYEAIS